MNTNIRISLALGIALGCLAAGPGAYAQSTVFTAPTFFGQNGTTYQEWDGYTSTTSNAPTLSTNTPGTPALGTANWSDSTASTDGAFVTGSRHVYSFSGVLHPVITVPGFGLGAGYSTTLVFQMETQGNPIDATSMTVTPNGGTAITYTSSSVTSTPVSGGMGGDDDVYRFTWSNLPGNAAGYTFAYSAGNTSVSHFANRVDTLATLAAAPEPGAITALGIGALCLGSLALRARRRTTC